MPVHDWTRVEAGIFHDFHTVWVAEIRSALNEGLLPKGYYALAELHAGAAIADVLTLHSSETAPQPVVVPPEVGGTLIAEAPPRVRRQQTLEGSLVMRRRTVAIRHVSNHRLVALLEIISPANKDRARPVSDFAQKAISALEAGIHLLIVDLSPPGPHDPQGVHGTISAHLEPEQEPYDLPANEPLTLAAYTAGPRIDAYLEHLGTGATLPEMPLFLRPDRYVNAPLDQTYLNSYRGFPSFWRDVLERRTEA